MMRPLSEEIRYYAKVSVLEGQESSSVIFNFFLGCVNVLRIGCNTRMSAASRNLRCFNNQFESSRLPPMIFLSEISKDGGQDRRRVEHGAKLPAKGPVLSGFRRGREFQRIPRAAGGRANPGRINQLLTTGSERAARQCATAEPTGAASAEDCAQSPIDSICFRQRGILASIACHNPPFFFLAPSDIPQSFLTAHDK